MCYGNGGTKLVTSRVWYSGDRGSAAVAGDLGVGGLAMGRVGVASGGVVIKTVMMRQ